VLLPGQAHGAAIDRKVDVAHHRALFDLGPPRAARAADLVELLLDHQFDVGTDPLIEQDSDVYEAHQGGEDFTRIDKDEGASCFFRLM
jgi:hypothetical protein